MLEWNSINISISPKIRPGGSYKKICGSSRVIIKDQALFATLYSEADLVMESLSVLFSQIDHITTREVQLQRIDLLPEQYSKIICDNPQLHSPF